MTEMLRLYIIVVQKVALQLLLSYPKYSFVLCQYVLHNKSR
jgi:hypothetical protein